MFVFSPRDDRDRPLRALLFDSGFDRYKGAIPLVAVKDGIVKKGTNQIPQRKFLSAAHDYMRNLIVNSRVSAIIGTRQMLADNRGWRITRR